LGGIPAASPVIASAIARMAPIPGESGAAS
jgi:hypothetical protein